MRFTYGGNEFSAPETAKIKTRIIHPVIPYVKKIQTPCFF